MAIVSDLSGNGHLALIGGVDQRLSSPNRRNAGTPVGSLVPQYSGELVLDTIGNQIFMGNGSTNADWLPVFVSI